MYIQQIYKLKKLAEEHKSLSRLFDVLAIFLFPFIVLLGFTIIIAFWVVSCVKPIKPINEKMPEPELVDEKPILSEA
ncbi:hypothetical protein [Flammeovirga sp. SJP92]|uniref:hypothetical protein n=1 Tax=Flammeovirga sp. SJP92 TaxID=1775430 RepID=UPI000786C824|nr:hypothetical protein [Flammeovirga sp. SJP92]KXX71833.1 hypothetical protein AVL50_03345 [Flammeovirga sp. SJP92]